MIYAISSTAGALGTKDRHNRKLLSVKGEAADGDLITGLAFHGSALTLSTGLLLRMHYKADKSGGHIMTLMRMLELQASRLKQSICFSDNHIVPF